MAATNRWTTWSCCTTTVTARNTAVEWERRALRPARGDCEGLSCVPGNRHAQFLGGGRAVRLSRYPTATGRNSLAVLVELAEHVPGRPVQAGGNVKEVSPCDNSSAFITGS